MASIHSISSYSFTRKHFTDKYIPQPDDSYAKTAQKIAIICFTIFGIFTLLADLFYRVRTSSQPIQPQPPLPLSLPPIPTASKFWTPCKKIAAAAIGAICLTALCYAAYRMALPHPQILPNAPLALYRQPFSSICPVPTPFPRNPPNIDSILMFRQIPTTLPNAPLTLYRPPSSFICPVTTPIPRTLPNIDSILMFRQIPTILPNAPLTLYRPPFSSICPVPTPFPRNPPNIDSILMFRQIPTTLPNAPLALYRQPSLPTYPALKSTQLSVPMLLPVKMPSSLFEQMKPNTSTALYHQPSLPICSASNLTRLALPKPSVIMPTCQAKMPHPINSTTSNLLCSMSERPPITPLATSSLCWETAKDVAQFSWNAAKVTTQFSWKATKTTFKILIPGYFYPSIYSKVMFVARPIIMYTLYYRPDLFLE